jgi:hypothetical protein
VRSGVLLLLAACGHIHFDEVLVGDGGGDGVVDRCAPAVTNDWALWPMPNTRDAALPHQPSYTVSIMTAVTDDVTGLEWERLPDVTLRTAAGAASYCDQLVLDGACDWRLPSRIELISIVDYSKSNPAVNITAFPTTTSELFWTSTPDISGTALQWYVNFTDGLADSISNIEQHRVRCVRGGASAPDVRYLVDGETVLDMLTGLRWERAVDAGIYTYDQSLAFCMNLNLLGGGWRMPSVGELQTLVDTTATNPAVDPVAFPASPAELFWTGSLRAFATTDGWTINFLRGFGFRPTTAGLRARCVRDI